MNKDLGGVGGVSRLYEVVYNLWIRSRWGEEPIRRFFLLVKLYERWSQIKTPAVEEKIKRWGPEVKKLVETMEHVPLKKQREEADQLADYVCGQMSSIIKDALGLNPEEHDSIGEDWQRAKEDSRGIEDELKKLPSTSNGNFTAARSTLASPSSTSNYMVTVFVCRTESGPYYTFGVPSPRRLTFPVQFADYSLCPLILYSLCHPQKHSERNIRPIAVQAMDALYLRYLGAQQSNKPAVWGPIDPCSPVTLRGYMAKSNSGVEVRFVSCSIRFLLVSTYQSDKHHEGIFDLDSSEQRNKLAQALKEGRIDTSARVGTSPASGGGSTSQSLPGPDPTSFENIIPRTSFVLKGPEKYDMFHPMHQRVNDLSFIP